MPKGINAAARTLGVKKAEAHRSIAIASIPGPVRAAADAAGLVNQAERLEAPHG